MEAILTLHQAGNQLGVEDTTLSRLIRVGGLPEARKVNRPEGLVWVIPEEDLPAIARRNGWTIDLRDGATELLIQESPDADLATGSAPVGSTGPTLLPDLEGWDAELWNTAVGLGLETAEIDLSDIGRQPETAQPAPTRPATETPTEPSEDAPASSLSPVAEQDRNSAIEVSIATAPVPAEAETSPVPAEPASPASPSTPGADPVESMVEALDLALLERLLEAQEGRVAAEVVAQENKHALAALNDSHNRTTAELGVERRERMVAADRYREERMARAVAEAKVAELRDRLAREVALADTEKAARTEALTRSVKAERDVTNAMASMGWRARRRFRKLSAATSKQIVAQHDQTERFEG